MTTRSEIRMSGFPKGRKSQQTQGISENSIGQSYPQLYPHGIDPLGAAIPIREVARLLGVSAWTIRQRYIPQGLPHLRSGPQGKLVFFRDQVIHWVLERQQKGGE
jgi:hypothetical protein